MVGMSYRDPTTKALIKIPTGCAGGGSPVGTVAPYVGSTAPVGWVICDGRAHNSPALRALLGSDNTPDLRGRFILAASSTHAAKTSGGEETHTLTLAEMPGHDHATGAPLANHSNTNPTWTNPGPVLASTGYSNENAETSYSGSRSEAVGGNGAHNNMPPYYALVYIIKAWAESAIGGITLPDADARYVNVSGDTMSGDLRIDGPERFIYFDRPGDPNNSAGIVIRRTDGNTDQFRVSSQNNGASIGWDTGAGFSLTQAGTWPGAGGAVPPGYVVTRAGEIVLQATKVRNRGADMVIPTPTDADELVNKQYVDGIVVMGEWIGTLNSEGRIAGMNIPDGYVIQTVTASKPGDFIVAVIDSSAENVVYCWAAQPNGQAALCASWSDVKLRWVARKRWY